MSNLSAKFTPLVFDEKSRTYEFPGGYTTTIYGVKRLYVSSSGTHYLETATDGKVIIPPKWIKLSVDAEKWSVVGGTVASE